MSRFADANLVSKRARLASTVVPAVSNSQLLVRPPSQPLGSTLSQPVPLPQISNAQLEQLWNQFQQNQQNQLLQAPQPSSVQSPQLDQIIQNQEQILQALVRHGEGQDRLQSLLEEFIGLQQQRLTRSLSTTSSLSPVTACDQCSEYVVNVVTNEIYVEIDGCEKAVSVNRSKFNFVTSMGRSSKQDVENVMQLVVLLFHPVQLAMYRLPANPIEPADVTCNTVALREIGFASYPPMPKLQLLSMGVILEKCIHGFNFVDFCAIEKQRANVNRRFRRCTKRYKSDIVNALVASRGSDPELDNEELLERVLSDLYQAVGSDEPQVVMDDQQSD